MAKFLRRRNIAVPSGHREHSGMSLGLAAVSMPQMLPMPMILTMMTTLAF